jgi:hypothetical protein
MRKVVRNERIGEPETKYLKYDFFWNYEELPVICLFPILST